MLLVEMGAGAISFCRRAALSQASLGLRVQAVQKLAQHCPAMSVDECGITCRNHGSHISINMVGQDVQASPWEWR